MAIDRSDSLAPWQGSPRAFTRPRQSWCVRSGREKAKTKTKKGRHAQLKKKDEGWKLDGWEGEGVCSSSSALYFRSSPEICITTSPISGISKPVSQFRAGEKGGMRKHQGPFLEGYRMEVAQRFEFGLTVGL